MCCAILDCRPGLPRCARRTRIQYFCLPAVASATADGGKDHRVSDLSLEITALFEAGSGADREQAREVFLKLRAALSAGTVRAAEPDASAPSGWRVNAWVKQGILLGFRFGVVVDMSSDHGRWPFLDKDTLPLKRFDPASGVRIVPGGSLPARYA